MKLIKNMKSYFKEKNSYEINKNPTEEQLQDNKNAKLSILFSIISLILYAITLFVITVSFQNNLTLGILSIFLFPIVTITTHAKAIKYSYIQMATNGKGHNLMIIAKYVVSVLFIIGLIFIIIGLIFLF